jgi:hypothetical protein
MRGWHREPSSKWKSAAGEGLFQWRSKVEGRFIFDNFGDRSGPHRKAKRNDPSHRFYDEPVNHDPVDWASRYCVLSPPRPLCR